MKSLRERAGADGVDRGGEVSGLTESVAHYFVAVSWSHIVGQFGSAVKVYSGV